LTTGAVCTVFDAFRLRSHKVMLKRSVSNGLERYHEGMSTLKVPFWAGLEPVGTARGMR
jgi:hypothetical protein